MAGEVVSGGFAGAGFGVRLVSLSIARGVRGILGHVSSPFQIGDRARVVCVVEHWHGASGGQGCAFYLMVQPIADAIVVSVENFIKGADRR